MFTLREEWAGIVSKVNIQYVHFKRRVGWNCRMKLQPTLHFKDKSGQELIQYVHFKRISGQELS